MLRCYLTGDAQKAVIERDTDLLTNEELVKCRPEIESAILKELETWTKFKCFSRKARRLAKNVIDTRWVLKWKWIKDSEGKQKRIIRARLTVRGFKDRDKGFLDTFAATSTKYSQRLIISEAVIRGWKVVTADVDKAAKGKARSSSGKDKSKAPEGQGKVCCQACGQSQEALRSRSFLHLLQEETGI